MADRKQDDLAPENHNSEQDDEQDQAQTLTEEALGGVQGSPLDSTKHKSEADLSDDSTQDLVDHMRDMEQSGRIDFDAFRGEDNHDDNEDKFGPGSKVDPDLPSDGS
jgi:hypothetical protein